jgi:hypothetical protein
VDASGALSLDYLIYGQVCSDPLQTSSGKMIPLVLLLMLEQDIGEQSILLVISPLQWLYNNQVLRVFRAYIDVLACTYR